MVLGALVIVVVGVLVVNYLRDNKGLLPGKGGVSVNQTEAKSHTVVPGETLWSISEKYYGDGYGWVDIAKANSISNPNLVEEGQTLSIPERETAQAPTTEEPTSQPQPVRPTSYTVQKGDHLWGIAVRNYGDGYKWVEIARANNLRDPNLLFVGTSLTLPK